MRWILILVVVAASWRTYAFAQGGGDDIARARTLFEEGVALFDALASAGAPADGIADARATAAALCKDKAVARQLVEGLESAAVGRSLLEAGAGKAAKDQTPSGALRRYMEGR